MSVPDNSSISAFDDPPISVPDYLPVHLFNDLRDMSSGDVRDDPSLSDFEDTPVSVPGDSSASVFDDPPISVPDYLPVSEVNDLRAFVLDGSWGLAVDSTFSGSNPERVLAFAQDIMERLRAAGISDFAAAFRDVMNQLPSMSETMQMDMALGLELDIGRTMKTVNFLMMTVMTESIGKESRNSNPTFRQAVGRLFRSGDCVDDDGIPSLL